MNIEILGKNMKFPKLYTTFAYMTSELYNFLYKDQFTLRQIVNCGFSLQ